uniref:Uncharacterized protein n=1 Tax=Anguilla anguilla TaxID=7936 RepID=A0A0E9SRL6_ANGAN
MGSVFSSKITPLYIKSLRLHSKAKQSKSKGALHTNTKDTREQTLLFSPLISKHMTIDQNGVI